MRHRVGLWLLAALTLHVSLTAQRGFAEILPFLEDVDRDEAREVAQRYLVAIPESHSSELRAWASQGDWRRQSLLLRVLGERGEAKKDELVRGFSSVHWSVRFEAARASGNSWRVADLETHLYRALSDQYHGVREEALLALARRNALDSQRLFAFIADSRLSSTICAVYLSKPSSFDASFLRALLAKKETRQLVLPRLCGMPLGEARAELKRFLRASNDDAERCWAMLALPREDWLPDVHRRVLTAVLAGRAIGAERLAAILTPLERAAFLDGIYAAPDEELRERLRLATPTDKSEAKRLLTNITECRDAVLSDVLAFVRKHKVPGLRDAAIHIFKSGKRDDRVLSWLQQVGPLVKDDPELSRTVLTFLRKDDRFASIAFRMLTAARLYDPSMCAHVMADPRRVGQRVGRLLSLGRRVPKSFWATLIDHGEQRVRWAACKALELHAGDKDVHVALVEHFTKEESSSVRACLVSSILAGADAAGASELLAGILERQEKRLLRSISRHCESSKQAWVDRFLTQNKAELFAREALVLRAMRGDKSAARVLIDTVRISSAPELMRVRKGLARALTKGDEAGFAHLLLGGKDCEKAPPWVREEVIAWLRLRPDLSATETLSKAFDKEIDPTVREQIAAALIERGRSERLLPLIERWVAGTTPDDEGLLLEVLGALKGKPQGNVLQFLVRLLVAPVLRDPLATVRAELMREKQWGRVESYYPLLRPTALALAKAEPAALEEGLVSELQKKELRKAWTSTSKVYLLLTLNAVRGKTSSLRALEPIHRWAKQLGPRPHKADSELLLLEARFHELRGELDLAARRFRAGLRELALARLPLRAVERISRDLVPDGGDFGYSTLLGKAAFLEAAAAWRAGQRDKALAAVRQAALASREDGTFHTRVLALLELMNEKPASKADKQGRR